jgi:hypothetical protein
MLWPRGRVDVLHALALAAGSREPLDRAFAALAEGDPLLAPWQRRLAPGFASGRSVAEVLRQQRLISRAEVGPVERSSDLPRTLRRIASASRGPRLRRLAMVWLPGALAATAGIGLMAGSAVTDLTSNQALLDLHVRLPLGYGSLGAWLFLPLAVLAIVSLLVATQALMTAIPWVRILRHLWCPEVQRAAARTDMVRALAARRERLAERHWRVWWFLTRLRLPKMIRRGTASVPHLEQRLVALGLLVLRDGGVDWEDSVADAERQEEAAVAASWLIVGPVFWMAGLGGFLTGVMQPQMMIVTQLNAPL